MIFVANKNDVSRNIVNFTNTKKRRGTNMQLHETIYGKNFFERDLPRLIKAIENLTNQLKVSNELRIKTEEKEAPDIKNY